MIGSLLMPSRLWRLLAADAANVMRDPLLVFVLVLSAMPAAGLGLWRQSMDSAALAAFGLPDLSRYLVPIALLLPASLIGWVAGFLMLEDRDGNLLPALAATPVGKTGFLVYRLASTAFATALVTAGALPILLPHASPWAKLTLFLVVPAAAIVYATILPALARNKVEGLALTKLTNLAAAIPLAALAPAPWRYLAGIVPTYWVGELTLAPANALPIGLAAGLAALVHAAWSAILLRRFAGRSD